MALSTAIGQERRSRVAGYKITTLFENVTTNLPQRIAILAEANNAQQTSLSTDARELTSAQQSGNLYGYGSPIHQIMRILRPISGDGVGRNTYSSFSYRKKQAEQPQRLTFGRLQGHQTQTQLHTVVVNGRNSLDFQNYSFTVLTTDTTATIASKIADAVNGVANSPITATTSTNTVTFTTKWNGTSSAELTTRIDVGDANAGVTYTQTTVTAGTGTPDLSTALNQFGETWYTIVINPFGSDSTVLQTLEQFNGVPDPDNPTGRWAGRIFMPFMAFFGNKLSTVSGLRAITDATARVSQVTNVLCAAPNSEAFSGEIAANVVTLFARTAQDDPHLDINNQSYPRLPSPS